jgi:hypothetical protein
VLGVPVDQSGWDVPTSVLAWRDPNRAQVTGALISRREGTLTNTSTYTPGTPTADQQVVTAGAHRLTATGYLDTSHGRVYTTVDRSLDNRSTHHWSVGETVDALSAKWTDNEKVTVDGPGRPAVTSTNRRYTIDGVVSIDTANRLDTKIAVTDAAASFAGGAWSWLDDTYRGEASWLTGVPRDQRHAVGTSAEHYQLSTWPHCYDHTIATTNGFVTRDVRRC